MLPIRQFVIVTLRRIVGEILDELPVDSLRIIEVDTLPIGMRVRHGRIFVAGRVESLAQRVRIVDLAAEMIDARIPLVRSPRPLRQLEAA